MVYCDGLPKGACDDREKHFNDLQSRYRSLAFTWLLASFAAMGFALSTKLLVPLPPEAVITGVAVAGAVGIALLWVLDVLVYHDLLITSHTVGKHLEKALPWMPPVRRRFNDSASRPKVRVLVGIFYAVGVDILCAGAALILLAWNGADRDWIWVPVLVGAVLTGIIYRGTIKALGWLNCEPDWIRP